MRTRPPIGARVRLLGNIGWGDFKGRLGTVASHHLDGIGFYVRVDGDVKHLGLDPANVQLAPGEKAVRA